MSDKTKNPVTVEPVKPKKPLCIELEEAKAELVNLANDFHKGRNIPFFMLESIFADVFRQVATNAAAERTVAKNNFNKQLEEYAKA